MFVISCGKLLNLSIYLLLQVSAVFLKPVVFLKKSCRHEIMWKEKKRCQA